MKRKIYQHDNGGKINAPMNLKLGVEGEYTSTDAREIICFATDHVTPVTAAQIFKKYSFFKPSVTAIKIVISKLGEVVGETVWKSICV